MPDIRLQFIRAFEQKISSFPQEEIQTITDALIRTLSDYEITERCTDIMPLDTTNERLMKQYLACLYVDGKSDKTAYQYKRTCERLAETIGKPFTEIGVYDIRYFLASEKARGVSARSVENTRANISAFFQWLSKEDLIPKNPCLSINPVKYPDVVRKPFSDIEIDKMRSACKSKKERAIIELLLSSGVRVSELTALQIADIDQSKCSVNVKCGKGGKGRVTYTTNVALRHLNAYWESRKEKGEMAFYNFKHEPLKPGGVRHMLNVLGDRAGVEHVHPHRFRRTFATNLAARGMTVQDIKILLGHSSIETTMEYVYMSNAKVSAEYQKYIN